MTETKYIKHYDINGNEITVATCTNCKNQVRTDTIPSNPDGIKSKVGINRLRVLDTFSNCCKNPYFMYYWED